MQATYFFNNNCRDKSMHGFAEGSPLTEVGTIEVIDSISEALNQAFEGFNRIDKPVPVLDDAKAPSMSVGDVVRISASGSDVVRWFAVERFGFKEIDAPAPITFQSEISPF